jgi:DNA-binding transcriptional ArsR family regulator
MANASAQLAVLADDTRRQVFERLAAGPATVGAIAAGLPVSRPAVSQHLKALRQAGLVTDRPEGTRRVYQIDPAGLGATKRGADPVSTIKPAPVRRSFEVKASLERAFEVFTAGIDRWWPRSHTIGKGPLKRAVLEPRAGGRWYGEDEDGATTEWGRVLAFEPPTRLLMAWQIGSDWKFNPELVTEVEVRFTATQAGATRVDFEHRHLERLGDAAEAMRQRFESPDGWGRILALYAVEAERSAVA